MYFQGLVYPALQTLIAKWAPPSEKGKFVSCLMGNTLGTCLTWPLVGSATMAWGWAWGFHMISLQHVVFCLIFFFVASDSPYKSKFVTEEELKYISEAQGKSVSKKSVSIRNWNETNYFFNINCNFNRKRHFCVNILFLKRPPLMCLHFVIILLRFFIIIAGIFSSSSIIFKCLIHCSNIYIELVFNLGPKKNSSFPGFQRPIKVTISSTNMILYVTWRSAENGVVHIQVISFNSKNSSYTL